MAVVRVRGVSKSHGRGRAARPALDRVDLDVRAGELVAVIGRSGVGKSTLLHVIAGLDPADEGTIEVAGRLVGQGRGDDELRTRHIGLVFQAFHLIAELSGEENVLLPTRLRHAPAGGAARAGRLIDLLGLRAVAERRPHELSGGEQQRIALARALVNDPSVVLADEPTGNLDSQAGAVVLRSLREVADRGTAVVLVTHDRDVADIAERTVRLEDGRLIAGAVSSAVVPVHDPR